MKLALYKETRPGLQGLYSRLTRWIDRGPYSHCELVFTDGMSASSSFIDGGVRFKNIQYDPDHWDFVPLPDVLETAARDWFRGHCGQPYDLWGNVRFVLGFTRESKGAWFCSEAVMAALGFAEPYRYGPSGAAALLKRFAWSMQPHHTAGPEPLAL